MQVTLQPNFHRVTFISSKNLTDFQTLQMGQGIQGIMGKSEDGSIRLQSVLFPRNKYSVNEATIKGFHLQKDYA
jgi:hypothetical protein